MSWWYPKFNRRGQIVSGNGTIWLNGIKVHDRDGVVLHGHSPQWFTDDVIFTSGEERKTYLLNIQTGERTTLNFEFNGRVSNVSALGAGAGHWCGWGPGSGAHGLYLDGQLFQPHAAPGAIDPATGHISYLTPYQANVRQIVINGSVVRTAHVNELTAGAGWVCWQDFSTRVPIAWGWTPGTGAMRLSPLPDTEYSFLSMAAHTPHGLWVATQTHEGFIVHPWGAFDGYIARGELFFPDMMWIAPHLVIIGTDSRGNLLRHDVDLSAPRGDLRSYRPSTGEPPPPPPPPPNGEKPVPYQRQSPDYKQFVQQTADRYPELWEAARKRPDGSRDDRFIRRLAWDLHQVDPRVGLNGKRGGDSISTDALAYHNTTAANNAEVIDVISGSHQAQWIDVTPQGVGKVITPTDPGGTPPPPPPPDDCEDRLVKVTTELATCRTENQLCRNEIERLLAEIERLKNLPPPQPKPCQCQIEGNSTIIRLFGIRCRPL